MCTKIRITLRGSKIVSTNCDLLDGLFGLLWLWLLQHTTTTTQLNYAPSLPSAPKLRDSVTQRIGHSTQLVAPGSKHPDQFGQKP